MRDKLIEDLKGFRTPICEGLNAKIPYAEELADYLLENGVVKRLIAQYEQLLNEFKSMPLGKFEFELLYKEKCKQLDNANSFIVELLADKEFSKINRTEYKKMVVSKMQTEIEKRCIKGGIYPAFVKSTIDQIAKEMLEGEK